MTSTTTVRRRCVFYLSGFDPKGAAHYHALYRDESALQAALSGQAITVGPRRKMPGGNASWSIGSEHGGHHTTTHYEFMRWDDVVRRHWPRSTPALWRDVVAASVFYLRHGAWWKMYRLSWPPAIAVFTPFLLVCAMLFGIPVTAFLSAWAIADASGHPVAGLVAGALVAAGLHGIGRRIEARYSMYWMMRSYAFTARQARGETPELEARLDELADCLLQRMRSQQDDEVLVVGHSSGAIMAASIVARALQQAPGLAGGNTKLGLLTLGQWIPLLGLLPMATRFRGELDTLARATGLTWTDFSAPPDGCCFALCDPMRACGVAREPGVGVDLKLLNPRFAALFDAHAYATLKRDKFRLHFQYLRASGKQGEYDYFAITAGHRTLADRFRATASVDDYGDLQPFRLRKHRKKPAAI